MARKRERIFSGFFAALFLLTSSALTIVVILQVTQGSGSDSSQSASKLQGTKLANYTPVTSVTQLQEQDLKAGTGATVKAGDTVTVDYTGAVASTGIIFQSSQDSGQSVPVTLKSGPNGVIEGWVQGVPGMKVGGTRRLLIPAALAYGANPPQGSGIPTNAALVFDVTVDKIGQ
ncbi:MAG TPA: FKBP-type peptidyl-prolyl cis-trans isomerase [Candidatus Saccharimonadales bacterium]|nr:FKBP-type peptidyl-prolyl cis-trans isomerase [Candidatus Saccharimonadales bacterium]